jgi:hypothetical protein
VIHIRNDLSALRKRCDALLATLQLSAPFNLRDLVERLAAQRARPIELVQDPLPDQVGLWLERTDRDVIYYPEHTSRFHQGQIILHEIAHIVLDHTSCDVVDDLLPHLSPQTIRRVLCRNSRSTSEEREAELFASLLLKQAAATHVPTGSTSMTPSEAFLVGLP